MSCDEKLASMKILIVDDTESVLLMMSRFVEALGHQVLTARNGMDALDAWRREQPDMLLMDMLMPVMSGPQAASVIKEESGETWIPIVFVTGVGEEKTLAEAIEHCADDYINKPVNFRVLEAKINAFQRTLELNRKVREQSVRLADYYDQSEEEKRVVRFLMEQLVNLERLADPVLDYWLAPAESLSGDLIAVARTPGQVLHVMLADGIGHGITAALNVLPLTQPFYSMTERGYTLSEILTEMNNKVRQVLPVGRFVAVVILSINEMDRCIEIWNGGMPDQKVLNGAGQVVDTCRSFSLPLGVVPSTAMEFSPKRFYFDTPGYVVACSDGLLEARNQVGEIFGVQRLLAALAEAPEASRIAETQQALNSFMDGKKLHDDVSLVLVRFGGGNAIKLNRARSDVAIDWNFCESKIKKNEVNWRYTLTLGVEELKIINVVPFIMNFVNEIPSIENARSEIFLILNELVENAIDYGILSLGCLHGDAVDENELFVRERSRKQECIKSGRIEIDFSSIDCCGSTILRVRVKDSGEGFDWHHFMRGNDTASSVGAGGIELVRSICSELRYQGVGNEVIAYYSS